MVMMMMAAVGENSRKDHVVCLMSLTSPGRSSAAPVWISSPRSRSRCAGPVQAAACGRCPALPANTGSVQS